MEAHPSTPNARQFTEEAMLTLRQMRTSELVGPIMLNKAGQLITWPIYETPRPVEIQIAEVVSIEDAYTESFLVPSGGEAA